MVTTRGGSQTKVAEKIEKTEKKEKAEKMDITEEPEEKSEEQKLKEKRLLILGDLKVQLKEVEKAGKSNEPRLISKVLRQLPKTRRLLDNDLLRDIIVPVALENREQLLEYIGVKPPNSDPKQLSIEVETYINLLVLIFMIDNQRLGDARELSDALVLKIGQDHGNHRSMDPLCAKIYYYHSRCYELLDRFDEIRPLYLRRLRTTTLHCETESESVLLNLLLRNFISHNLHDQAEKLVSKSVFPETANNNEWARYLYYTGKIKAIQLEYSDAQKTLTNAIRKAPQKSAVGFRQAVTKLLVVVELLLGDIPERSRFKQKCLEQSLEPYFAISQAVRHGNLASFNKVVEKYSPKFKDDHTLTLILRLRHNVIKTGVRRISLAYSFISLSDIASKLALDSPEDAEFIVAKAIRDGVIDAQIDHKNGYVSSHNKKDIYSTRDPEQAFNNRIQFCLNLHAQSVKAMRFPPRSYYDPMTAEERRQKEAENLEYAKELAEDDDDIF